MMYLMRHAIVSGLEAYLIEYRDGTPMDRRVPTHQRN